MSVNRKAISLIGTGTRTNTVIPAPGGITNGDLLVILEYAEVATVTPPAGFTPFTGLGPRVFPVHTTTTFWAWRKVASGESGDYTLTHANTSAGGVLLVYTGQDITIEDVNPSLNSGNNDSNVVANGVTVVTPGSRVILAGGLFNVPGGEFSSFPDGGTPTFNPFSPTVNPLTYTDAWGLFASDALAGAGATGNKTLPDGPPIDDWVSTLIVIRAAESVGGGSALFEEMMS